MKDRAKIVALYSGVAVVSALIVGFAMHVGNGLPEQPQVTVKEDFTDIGADHSNNFLPIARDLAGFDQAGEQVKLSDLKGKVWVVTEFYSVCPMCAVRNGAQMGEIQNTFKNDPDFHMVSISLDPGKDDKEMLGEYAQALNAEKDHWWLLNTGEEKATHAYLENTLGFFGVRERTDPNDIETNGRFAHDMGIMLVDRNFNVIAKYPLEDARSEEAKHRDPGLYDRLKADLYARIRQELDKTETAVR